MRGRGGRQTRPNRADPLSAATRCSRTEATAVERTHHSIPGRYSARAALDGSQRLKFSDIGSDGPPRARPDSHPSCRAARPQRGRAQERPGLTPSPDNPTLKIQVRLVPPGSTHRASVQTTPHRRSAAFDSTDPRRVEQAPPAQLARPSCHGDGRTQGPRIIRTVRTATAFDPKIPLLTGLPVSLSNRYRPRTMTPHSRNRARAPTDYRATGIHG